MIPQALHKQQDMRCQPCDLSVIVLFWQDALIDFMLANGASKVKNIHESCTSDASSLRQWKACLWSLVWDQQK